MGIKKILVLIIFLMAGCATSSTDKIQSVSDNYETVDFGDGIDLEESKIVAQRQLIKKNVVDLYDLFNPQVNDDVSELPNHQDFWFIFFEEKNPSNIPFIFTIIVDKKTGKIKFADDYNEGNQWILEAALLH